MSVQTGAPAEGVTEPVTEATQGDPAEQLGEGGKAALATERAARKASDAALAKATAALKKIENANLGELERAQKDAAEARTSLADLIKQTTRQKVALTKELPAGAVDFLRGDTEEEFTASADNLLALIAQLNAPKALKPDPSQGPKAQAIALNGDPLLEALKGKLGIS